MSRLTEPDNSSDEGPAEPGVAHRGGRNSPIAQVERQWLRSSGRGTGRTTAALFYAAGNSPLNIMCIIGAPRAHAPQRQISTVPRQESHCDRGNRVSERTRRRPHLHHRQLGSRSEHCSRPPLHSAHTTRSHAGRHAALMGGGWLWSFGAVGADGGGCAVGVQGEGPAPAVYRHERTSAGSGSVQSPICRPHDTDTPPPASALAITGCAARVGIEATFAPGGLAGRGGLPGQPHPRRPVPVPARPPPGTANAVRILACAAACRDSATASARRQSACTPAPHSAASASARNSSAPLR
jgi:hypothetical protein